MPGIQPLDAAADAAVAQRPGVVLRYIAGRIYNEVH